MFVTTVMVPTPQDCWAATTKYGRLLRVTTNQSDAARPALLFGGTAILGCAVFAVHSRNRVPLALIRMLTPSFASSASRKVLRDRTQQAELFFPVALATG